MIKREHLFRILAFCIVSVFIFFGISSADTVMLKNGGKISGTVVKDNGSTVIIDIGAGTVVQNKKDIARVEQAEAAKGAVSERVNYTKKTPPAARVKAPPAKARVSEVFDMLTEGVKSILRFDFLKKK